jgi:hypothetical protein
MGGSAGAGVLVVRAWIDADHVLRARITYFFDPAGTDHISRVVAGPEAVQVAVRDWLESLQSARSQSSP